jgi:O-antigen/teichoic acid export membrane protein
MLKDSPMAEHETKGIGQIALQGGLKMFLSQGVKLVVQIASIVVLARLVTPEDFGLVAFLTSIFAFVGLFSEFGLTMAIVQKEQIQEKDLNTLFRISASIGMLLLLCIGVAGLVTAWISGDARYQWIFVIFAVMFFFKSLSTVPQGLIRRRLQFGFLSLQEAGAFLFGAMAAVAIATQGRGILALMAFQLIPGLLMCTSSWFFSGWRPHRSAGSIQEASSYFSFGGAFTLVEIANTVCKHIDNLLIGKVWGMEMLGQYTRAYALMLAPMNQVMGPLGAVLIPSFSRIHQNKIEFKKLTTALFISFVGLTAPSAALIFVYTNTIVNLLLGPGWEVAEKIFWWFGFAVFCKPLGCIVYWIFVSSGKMKQMMRWTVVNMVLTVCAILVGLQYGPIRVAALFSISEITLQIPIAIYLLGKTKLIPVGKWYKIYILGLGLLAGSYCVLLFMQEKLCHYSLSTNAQLVISLILAATLSIFVILANPESRNLVKDCKDRIF